MRLGGSDEQAITLPLLHHELVRLQRCAQAARFSVDLAGQWDDLPVPHEGSRGRPPVFSNAAIQFCSSIKVLFKLPLR